MKTFTGIVFSSIIAVYCSCTASPPVKQLVNNEASLPASFQFDKLGLKVIATFIDKNERTMSTLYGNSIALQAAKTGEHKIGTGGVFVLITWKQQADGNWYGANIPGELLSVELIHSSPSARQTVVRYDRYKGKSLMLDSDTIHRGKRVAFILNQRASVLP
jgi:hypothetical protein